MSATHAHSLYKLRYSPNLRFRQDQIVEQEPKQHPHWVSSPNVETDKITGNVEKCGRKVRSSTSYISWLGIYSRSIYPLKNLWKNLNRVWSTSSTTKNLVDTMPWCIRPCSTDFLAGLDAQEILSEQFAPIKTEVNWRQCWCWVEGKTPDR